MTELVVARPAGLYCPVGDFYIDPMRPVPRAVITHAHADHARGGHGHYIAAAPGEAVLRARLGRVALHSLAYGESLSVGDVRLSLHPAGHVLGSAQVRLEHRGEVWVVSGDYKLEADRSCTPFEPVRCHTFITESTFALPIYRWAPQAEVFADLGRWWAEQAAAGRVALLHAYSLGKAQRLLAGLDPNQGPIYCPPAVQAINQAYRSAGVQLPVVHDLATLTPATAAGALVLGPVADLPGLPEWATARAVASGWTRTRAGRRSGTQGFTLSDHADWPGLLAAVQASGAQRVVALHGDGSALARWLRERHGLRADTALHTDP